jgi:hypothetical protein
MANMKPEPILSGFEGVGSGGQGPQWAVKPVEEEGHIFYY